MLWQNAPSVIVGRFQDICSEVNLEFINNNNIKLARRNSGGGAVYHDLGNLNYSFIIYNNYNKKIYDFKYFAGFIIDALNKLGVQAAMSERNDILFNHKKISGMAMYKSDNIILCHGTLLYDCDLNIMNKALSVDNKILNDKLSRHGVKSIKSRVINLKDNLINIKDINEFKLKLKENLNFNLNPFILPIESHDAIDLIMQNKYLNFNHQL